MNEVCAAKCVCGKKYTVKQFFGLETPSIDGDTSGVIIHKWDEDFTDYCIVRTCVCGAPIGIDSVCE